MFRDHRHRPRNAPHFPTAPPGRHDGSNGGRILHISCFDYAPGSLGVQAHHLYFVFGVKRERAVFVFGKKREGI